MTVLTSVPRSLGHGWTSAAKSAGRWSTTRVRIISAVIALLLLAVAGGCGYLFYVDHHDRSVAQMRDQALAAAVADVPALLSYKADNIEQDFAGKYGLVTGDFKTQFENLTKQTIIPAAKQQSLTTKAQVASAGVSSVDGDSVTVLLFINQSTTSNDQPGTKLDGSRVQVVMTKVGDQWKVAGLTPV